MRGMNPYPPPYVRPVTVREAIGHLNASGRTDEQRRKELIDAWHKCPPGRSLRKMVPNVSSFGSVRLHPDRPSTTQTANHFNWHYAAPRYLSVEETALIGGFPSRFRWPARQERCKRQIGNSVPPPFMRAIAQRIREETHAA
jgi:site-specific DNA-cytosine methylase